VIPDDTPAWLVTPAGELLLALRCVDSGRIRGLIAVDGDQHPLHATLPASGCRRATGQEVVEGLAGAWLHTGLMLLADERDLAIRRAARLTAPSALQFEDYGRRSGSP